MNKRTLITIIPAAALLLLAACTQDEPGGQGNELPYGEYPLQISGVTFDVESSAEPWSAEGPQTRVAEDNTDGMSSVWEWNGSEMIRVQLGDETADYTLNAGKTLTSDKQLYWTSTAPATVTAWYPTNETVDLSDQSEGLAYMLKAEVPDATYDNVIALGFKHQLAKVRVVLSGTQAALAQSVEVYGYTTCTNNEGAPVTDNAQQGWLKMKKQTYGNTECWEANVVPDVVIDRVKVNGIETTLTTSLTPVVAALNTITITVEQASTEIDLSTYDGTTLTVSGKTILKGDGQPKNLQVTVEPDTELTLQDVNLSYNEGPTIICQGTAHISLSGNNKLSPASKGINYLDANTLGSGIEVRSSGTLTIESEPNAALDITRRRNEGPGITPMYGAGIGLYENANLVIKGGTITVTGGSPTAEGGANIGGFVSQNAGTITLEGGTFTLQNQCMLSSLVGAGSYGTCGTVTIRAGVTINGTTYAEDHVGVIKE